MADATWKYYAAAVTLAATKNLISIHSIAAAAKTIKIYRMFMFNTTTTGTGIYDTILLYRFTNSTLHTGGTALTGIAHQSNNAALSGSTTGQTGATTNVTKTAANCLRRWGWGTDEMAVSTVLDLNALETLVPFAQVWDSGYGDSNVQPLTCVSGVDMGYVIQNAAATVGTVDCEIEFTNV